MTSPFRVGLTGGIGSGKTTVCNLFAQLGVPIIDTDEISRTVVEPGSQGLKEIIDEFGINILNDDGSLDRQQLRKIVFNDTNLLSKLNSILHPLIYNTVEDEINLINYSYCIIAIPLLFETNGRKHIDRVLLIDSPKKLQIERTIKRDDVSSDNVERIIESQMPREEKIKLSDDIIDNSYSLEYLSNEVTRLDKLYRTLSKAN